MTTPDPKLAARLAAKLKCATEDPSLVNLARFVNSCADAFEAGQLITTSEADARVKAAVLLERERAKRADCDAFSNPLKDCC